MYTLFLAACGGAAASFSFLVGGYDHSFIGLIIFMVIDYATGVITALCNKSTKTPSGGLSSKAGFRGLLKKAAMLGLVIVANTCDYVMDTHGVRQVMTYALIANELLSILENAGLLGIPVPNRVKHVVEVLRGEEESE